MAELSFGFPPIMPNGVSANQPHQPVTHQADPEVYGQSPIDLLKSVLRARRQEPLQAEVNSISRQHSNQGLPEPPFHEARFSSRVAIMKFTGFRVAFCRKRLPRGTDRMWEDGQSVCRIAGAQRCAGEASDQAQVRAFAGRLRAAQLAGLPGGFRAAAFPVTR